MVASDWICQDTARKVKTSKRMYRTQCGVVNTPGSAF